jgi:hypothetical protein
MGKTADNVLTEWEARGYCGASPSDTEKAKYRSFISQGRQSILAYCNLPLSMEELPDGLFYPWVEISYAILTGGVFERASGVVKSVKEGDQSVTYDRDRNSAATPAVDYSSVLNRFRRLL